METKHFTPQEMEYPYPEVKDFDPLKKEYHSSFSSGPLLSKGPEKKLSSHSDFSLAVYAQEDGKVGMKAKRIISIISKLRGYDRNSSLKSWAQCFKPS